MLKIVGKPFFKEKMSDESTYEQIAIESISQLGKLVYIYYSIILFKIKTLSVSEGPYLWNSWNSIITLERFKIQNSKLYYDMMQVIAADWGETYNSLPWFALLTCIIVWFTILTNSRISCIEWQLHSTKSQDVHNDRSYINCSDQVFYI